MKFITNTSWEYSEIIPDYAVGRSTAILFLSIRYHQLNPDYIHDRLKQLGKAYNLRVLLVQVIFSFFQFQFFLFFKFKFKNIF